MNIFSNLTSDASIAVILWLLGAFSIGIALGWFFWGRFKAGLEQEIEQLNAQNKVLTNDNTLLKGRIAQNEIDLEKADASIGAIEATLRKTEAETAKLHKNIYNLKDNLKIAEDGKRIFAQRADILSSELEEVKVKRKTLATELAQWKAQAEAIEQDYALLQEQIALKEAAESVSDEPQPNTDLPDNDNLVLAATDTPDAPDSTVLSSFNAQIAAATIADLTEKVDELEEDIEYYKAEISNLKQTIENSTATTPAATETPASPSFNAQVAAATIADLTEKVDELEEDIEHYKVQISELQNTVVEMQTLTTNLKKANVKVAVLEGTIEGMKEELALKENGGSLTEEQAIDAITAELIAEEEATVEMPIEEAMAVITKALDTTVGKASVDTKDDLTAIKGIGTFLEAKLNGIGIFTYQQIANFDDAMIASVTRAIDFFPNRIVKDNWVGQAQNLLESTVLGEIVEDDDDVIEVEGAPAFTDAQEIDAKTAVKAMIGGILPVASAEEADDLTQIEGIGAFISQRLNDLGIYTFEQVAAFDDEVADKVTEAIAFFPGRIQRDGWVIQARVFAKKKKVAASTAVLKAKIGTVIDMTTPDEADDLKEINGIGAFLEEKLNKLGINSFKQVSQLDAEAIDALTEAIEFFQGRIERDKWVEQATELYQNKLKS